MSITGSDQEPVDLLDVFFGCVQDCPSVPAVETSDGTHSYEEIASLASQMAATIQQLTENPYPRVLVAPPPSQRAYAAMLGELYTWIPNQNRAMLIPLITACAESFVSPDQ